jgi:septal ring factor EnvC (AmiA/AmiB activator)
MGSRRSSSFEMGVASGGSSGADQLLQQQKSVEDRLKEIKDEIARRRREAEELEAAAQARKDGKSRKKRKTGECD